jgi:hypothetical protein
MFRLIGMFRLAVAVTFLLVAWLSFWSGQLSGWWLLVPIVTFLGLVIVHDRVDQKKRRALKAVTFYEDGLARIDDLWMGRGPAGEHLCDDSHLYAADLDLFGQASLFELLCTARTQSGEQTLADWLTAPAGSAEILARQEAIDELRSRIDLREDLAILGSDIRPAMHPDTISRWGAAAPVLEKRWPQLVGFVLSAFVMAALAAAWITDTQRDWLLLFGTLACVGTFAFIYRIRVNQVLSDAARAARDLELLSQILVRLEREDFHSPKLAGIMSSLRTKGVTPSRQIVRFARLVDMCDWKRADVLIVFVSIIQAGVPFAPFLFGLWSTHVAFALESWRRQCGPAIGRWISTVGEFEALCALSGYAYEHPEDPFPEVAQAGPVFEGEDLCHPLIPRSQCVPNSVRIGAEPQLLVVSGSNMSGKSTLLRTVGVNAVLALAGAPVRARRLRLSPLAIGATLRVQDSLQAGTSRFYAEIQRIRYIMDLTRGELPVLFLLDELLHGTNSHDRAVGAAAIVGGLIRRQAIGLATTHDLALAKVAYTLAPSAANIYFDDRLKDGQMIFDYLAKPGVVQNSNALELMKAVGLDDLDHVGPVDGVAPAEPAEEK